MYIENVILCVEGRLFPFERELRNGCIQLSNPQSWKEMFNKSNSTSQLEAGLVASFYRAVKKKSRTMDDDVYYRLNCLD